MSLSKSESSTGDWKSSTGDWKDSEPSEQIDEKSVSGSVVGKQIKQEKLK